MGTLFRKIVWLVVSAAIIYAGYRIYTDWWNGEIPSLGRIREYAQNILETKSEDVGRAVEQKAGEYIQSVTQETKQGTVQYLKEKTHDIFTTVGEELISKTRDFFGISSSSSTGIGSLGNAVIPAPTGPGFFVPSPPATISFGVDLPFVISINRGASYTVNWGSGTNESGVTTKSGLTILKHSWDKEGDYTVKVSVNDNGKTNEYTFPIRIYK